MNEMRKTFLSFIFIFATLSSDHGVETFMRRLNLSPGCKRHGLLDWMMQEKYVKKLIEIEIYSSQFRWIIVESFRKKLPKN